MPSALSGKALTVLGAVDAEAMGVTLPHEHLLIDFAKHAPGSAGVRIEDDAIQVVVVLGTPRTSGARKKNSSVGKGINPRESDVEQGKIN